MTVGVSMRERERKEESEEAVTSMDMCGYLPRKEEKNVLLKAFFKP